MTLFRPIARLNPSSLACLGRVLFWLGSSVACVFLVLIAAEAGWLASLGEGRLIGVWTALLATFAAVAFLTGRGARYVLARE